MKTIMKKTAAISAVIMAVTTFCGIGAFADAAGDVNGDGFVNVTDVSIISAYIKGIKTLENTEQADINEDGRVYISDISIIAAKVKGYDPNAFEPTSTADSPSYLMLTED